MLESSCQALSVQTFRFLDNNVKLVIVFVEEEDFKWSFCFFKGLEVAQNTLSTVSRVRSFLLNRGTPYFNSSDCTG